LNFSANSLEINLETSFILSKFIEVDEDVIGLLIILPFLYRVGIIRWRVGFFDVFIIYELGALLITCVLIKLFEPCRQPELIEVVRWFIPCGVNDL
jgi:hypothetical protein